MNEKLVIDDQIKILQKKLHAAIKSRAAIDTTLKSQSTVLSAFIIKLSHACKGIDTELDNRLAGLRTLFTQSAPMADVERQTAIISKLLQKHALKVEKEITRLQALLLQASTSLQKSKGVPNGVRRELREFIGNIDISKKTQGQYLPLFAQLIALYEQTLKTSDEPPKGGLLNAPSLPNKLTTKQAPADTALVAVNEKLLGQFSQILGRLVLSSKHNQQLNVLKGKLNVGITSDGLLHSCLQLFEVIIADFQQERETAESFLSTLSQTLSTVQCIVKKTLSLKHESQSAHNELNTRLQDQILTVAKDVENAGSLAEIKTDINVKIQRILGSLEQKFSLEDKHNRAIDDQLSDMTNKVSLLEKQSDDFEKRLHEQQIKSMQDALTKLGNRAAFDDYFAKEFARYHHKAFDLAIVIMDLDNFKRINDTYGHSAGDKTLQVIANTLKKQVSKNIFVGRYGGEEFVLIYSNIKKTQLMADLNKLRQNVARLPFKFKNTSVTITTSIGVSHVLPSDNIHIAFERADQAL